MGVDAAELATAATRNTETLFRLAPATHPASATGADRGAR